MIVIDASAALAWLLPSQATEAAWSFLEATTGHAYAAPFVFGWEVRNALLVKARQGVLPRHQLQPALDQIGGYGVACGEPVDVTSLTPLAISENISLFDASYLALAMDAGEGLASLDRALLSAAVRCGVNVYDLRADP